MRYLILAAILYGGSAAAAPDEIHGCLAWMTVYSQTHNDERTNSLQKEFAEDLRQSKIYNPTQFKEAMNDPNMMASAKKDGKDSNRTLSYCSKLAYDFIR